MTAVVILGDGLLASSIHDVRPDWPMIGHQVFDIQDHDSIVRVLRQYKPDAVINTVATHALGFCERNASLAFDVNARGADRVASLVPTVYISTDYVFSEGGPHDEVMPGRQPRSVYGRSKLAGELATLENDGIVVRVSGLYGHHRSHKGPTFPEMILSGWEPIDLPTDQVFSPTYAPDAAQRIALLAEMDAGVAGTYHAANAGSVSWAVFGQEIVALARHRRKIKAAAARDSLRPTNSALRSTRLPPLRNWRVALDAWWGERMRMIRASAISPLREGA